MTWNHDVHLELEDSADRAELVYTLEDAAEQLEHDVAEGFATSPADAIERATRLRRLLAQIDDHLDGPACRATPGFDPRPADELHGPPLNIDRIPVGAVVRVNPSTLTPDSYVCHVIDVIETDGEPLYSLGQRFKRRGIPKRWPKVVDLQHSVVGSALDVLGLPSRIPRAEQVPAEPR